MNISSLSIKNPIPAIVLFIILTIMGLYGFMKLGIQDMPDMDLPTITVSASLEGAAPEQLETEVARKIEDKLTSLTKLDHITTTITDGSVNISVSFELEKDVEVALSEVRNAVDGAKADLPASMNSPTVSKVTAAGSSLLTYSITSDNLDEQDLSWFVDNDVSNAIMTANGVNSVSRVGGVDREVQIDLNPTLMAGLGVMPSDVSKQLKAVQQEASGGQGRVGGERQSIRTLATVKTADDIREISIPLQDGRYIRLDQVAQIHDTTAERTTRAYLNGKPIIGFQVERSKGYSDVEVVKHVREAIAVFQQKNPAVKIEEISNKVDSIQDNYDGSMTMLYEGALLAIIVVFIFLKNWRTTFISAVALPLSIIPAFGVMYYLGYSLNVITLLALSLVVGILVDDAIVEVENIERHLEQGKTPYQAAMEAADEIGLAVVATTLTLVAIFLPTAFMGGIAGLVFKQFGITASVAILFSLLVARLLTPMMAAYMLKPKNKKDETKKQPDGWVMRHYKAIVNFTLNHRKTTILGASAFFFVTLFIGMQNSVTFMPAQDKSQTTVTVELPPGSTLDQTAKAAEEASKIIQQNPNVKQVFSSVGTASSGSGMDSSSTADVASATLTVELTPYDERDTRQSAVEQDIREKLKPLAGVKISVGGGNTGEKLDITLASDNADLLTETANNLEVQMRGLKGIGNVSSSAAIEQPEVQITPDFAKAAQLGVTSEALSDAIRYATYGGYSTTLPKLNLDQRQIAIRVRLDPSVRNDLSSIAAVRVQGSNGSVSLGSIADIQIQGGPTQISRMDRMRNVTLSIELNGLSIGEVQNQVMQLEAMKNLPQGVKQIQQGELQNMSEMFTSFGLAMFIGIVCVYAVLVLLFHDFLQPGTILSALPLALGGAFVALYICSMPYSMPVVIGILMLMGIVTKNSILLVDYTIIARNEHGLSRYAAVMDACSKRARPIIMTTIAMAAGMMPNALGLGAEPSFRQPTAVVVIGGLITSTVLSLVVIPVIFTYVDDLHHWIKSKFKSKAQV
ncbi:efflux RND transporter permease subunit [Acinetobacter indicus]|uniref:efflux RND transporter permease subunit n=1 Tax=Acinetobacter indicus TaxID=756892 RepID=UPI0012668613|nr:efflux RND transporter permease subunit [Acinetobacter indicus]QFS17348.1 efflux RND transporter permease subunit [Acinetobacter indicus]